MSPAWEGAKDPFEPVAGQRAEIAHAAAGEQAVFFREGVGELREHLRRTDADAAREAEQAQHRLAGGPGVRTDLLRRQRRQVQKTFVHRGHLLRRGETREHAHHPRGHVGVEFEVRGERDDTGAFGKPAHLEPRHGHADADGLRLGGPGDDTPVVVREHDDGPAFQ